MQFLSKDGPSLRACANHYLALCWLLSISLVFIGAAPARSHELNPTVADFVVIDGTMIVDLRLNAEAFLAGLDLDGVSNTDETARAADYNVLQGLVGFEIQQKFAANADVFLRGLVITGADQVLPTRFVSIETPAESLQEVARLSSVRLEADLQDWMSSVTFSWAKGNGELVIRQQGVEAPFTGFLQGGEVTPPINLHGGAALNGWQSFMSYIPVGFDHILPKGLDHILFVLGLFFLSLCMGALLWQVTAFTLAHTVTLALGALGLVNVPGSVVEPIIAASIVYVGVENIFSKGLSRSRPVVVFGLGLLHGLGFASVLGDFGLPSGQFVPALLGFNIGVELGQLTVIACAYLAVGLWFGKKPWYKAYVANPASALIALVGAYWVIERVLL